MLIVVGYFLGILGDQFQLCPHALQGSCPPNGNATFFLAEVNGLVIYYHQYYQLFSSIFVTDSPLDAGFNAVAVLILDRFTDEAFNKTRYFLIFFLSALLGNLFTLGLGPAYASAGASGGIFGIFAAVFSFGWAREKKIDVVTLGFFLLIFVGSSILPGVNSIAHIGGALGGFFAGPLLYINLRPKLTNYENADQSSPLTELLIATLFVVVTTASVIQFFFFVGI